MNNWICTSIVLLIFCSFVEMGAQTVGDALRYSNYEIGGTARFLGTGSSLGALGADFSVTSTNPAGVGMFRRSEFVITPAVAITSVKTELMNEPGGPVTSESNSNFSLNNLGVVIATQPRNPNWSTLNFAIGFNRLANFNQTYAFEGQSIGSIVDRFQELANSRGLDDFEAGVAFDAGAIYDFNDNGFFNSDFELAPDAIIARSQRVESKGSINELVLSFGANYKEKVAFGLTIGVPFVNFTEEKNYFESDPGDGADGNVPFFDDLEWSELLNTTGTGINLKLGLIYRVNQMVRIGAAVHTPSSISLEDNFSTEMTYRFTEDQIPQTGNAISPDGNFSYKLSTPWRTIGSVGVIIKKSGFISAEIEYLNYGSNKFKFNDFPEDADILNEEIATALKSAVHFRVGGEMAMDAFRFRAGVGVNPSPVVDESKTNLSFSAGAGYRKKNFFMDLGYRRSDREESYLPYLTTDFPEQMVNKKTGTNKILLTIGFKF